MDLSDRCKCRKGSWGKKGSASGNSLAFSWAGVTSVQGRRLSRTLSEFDAWGPKSRRGVSSALRSMRRSLSQWWVCHSMTWFRCTICDSLGILEGRRTRWLSRELGFSIRPYGHCKTTPQYRSTDSDFLQRSKTPASTPSYTQHKPVFSPQDFPSQALT